MGPIFMAKRHLRLVTPAIVNRTVKPRRHPNASLRTREYLTEAEVERLMKAARRNRWGHRDATMILVAYRHGLRASELVDLRWEQIEFRAASLHVRRVEQGTPSTHLILGDELRALRRHQSSPTGLPRAGTQQNHIRDAVALASFGRGLLFALGAVRT
jgi:integrase